MGLTDCLGLSRTALLPRCFSKSLVVALLHLDGTARALFIDTGVSFTTRRLWRTRKVTAGDQDARIGNADTGQELFALHGHQGFVLGARFSADQTIQVWEALRGKPQLTLTLTLTLTRERMA